MRLHFVTGILCLVATYDSGDARRLASQIGLTNVTRREPYDMVERFFGMAPSRKDRLEIATQMKISYGSTGTDPNRVIPLVARPSPFVKGLLVYMSAEEAENKSDATQGAQLGLTRTSWWGGPYVNPRANLANIMDGSNQPYFSKGKPVIVGTVRMGFGHHRIAYSAITWALEKGMQPYLMDILAIDCPESRRVVDMDKAYSKLSRVASNFGGIVEAMWTKLMASGGGLNTLRFSCQLANQLRPLMAGLPKDVPVISTHPWIGQIAVACGFKTVINLVIDNHPQWFVLVAGALNLVQAPSYYQKLLQMKVPAKQLKYAGHWVSRDIVTFAVEDSQARINRCQRKDPLRLLVAIGGAGAQQKYVLGFVLGMRHLLASGRVKLIINSGDHAFMADKLSSTFDKEGLEYVVHRSQEALNRFLVTHQLAASEVKDDPMITIFNFAAYHEAFRATDLLIRVTDVLATKPSELAFFPVPKLSLRHVGGHESYSAVRSCELGDGTVECLTVQLALENLELLAKENSPMFMQMNKCIIESAKAKLFDGSKVAIEIASGETAAPSVGSGALSADCQCATK